MWRDSETEIDYLNFDYIIKLLTELIDNDNLLPATIGVYGDWGSGKSSLIKMAMKKIQEQENSENIETINFNGWLFEGYEDAKSVLLETILDTIKENSTLTTKGKQILKGLYKSIDKIKLASIGIKYTADLFSTGGLGIMVDQIASQIKKNSDKNITETQLQNTVEQIQSELNYSDIRNDLKKFQDEFEDLLKESKIDKLVIFIDELDRCGPDTIIQTLEAMRLFVFKGQTVFIIGADERHIAYSVERKFSEIKGNQIDIGKEYLEKLVQYPIRIPRLDSSDTEFYIFCLLVEDTFEEDVATLIIDKVQEIKQSDFLNFNLTNCLPKFSEEEYYEELSKLFMTSQQLAGLLSTGLNGNPRQCKRFLNSMKMREIMASAYSINLDRMVLTKVMLLEYFKPAAFEQLTILSSKSSNGIIDDLKQAEENEDIPTGNSFENFFNDNWGKEWLGLSPKLGGIDLRGYLFFTRDSLRTPIKASSLGLSKDGLKVYKFLTAEGASSLASAMELKDTLSQFDRIEIVKLMSNEIKENGEKIKLEHLRGLFEWITNNKDILDDTIIFLESIDGKNVSLGLVPLINKYIEDENKSDHRVIDVINKWKKENTRLSDALTKSEVR